MSPEINLLQLQPIIRPPLSPIRVPIKITRIERFIETPGRTLLILLNIETVFVTLPTMDTISVLLGLSAPEGFLDMLGNFGDCDALCLLVCGNMVVAVGFRKALPIEGSSHCMHVNRSILVGCFDGVEGIVGPLPHVITT